MPPLLEPVQALPQTPDTTSETGQLLTGAPSASLFSFKPVAASAAAAAGPVFVAVTMAELVIDLTSAGSGRHWDGFAVWRIIGEAAATLIPGAERAGVLLPVADSPSNEWGDAADGGLQSLMRAQDSTGEGPCLDAARGGEQVLVHDLHTDARWPRFTPRSPWQTRSLLCTPIPVSGDTIGVLTVVSGRAWAFDDTAARLAAVVAMHATLALAHLEEVRNLQAVADSRDVIGQAKGMLMQRHQLTAEQAFSLLTAVSQQRNVKLRTLCQYFADFGRFPAERPR